MLALNGFREHVRHSSCYPLMYLTRNLSFAGKVPFSYSGSHIFVTLLGKTDHFVITSDFEILTLQCAIHSMQR